MPFSRLASPNQEIGSALSFSELLEQVSAKYCRLQQENAELRRKSSKERIRELKEPKEGAAAWCREYKEQLDAQPMQPAQGGGAGETAEPTRTKQAAWKVKPSEDSGSLAGGKPHSECSGTTTQMEIAGGLPEVIKEQDVNQVLPVLWPASLELRDAFQASTSSTELAVFVGGVNRMQSFTTSWPSGLSGARKKDITVLHPNSRMTMAMDFVGVVAVMHDAVVIPVVLAWQLRLSGYLLITSWLTGIIWVIDILLCLNTGFYRNGELQARRSAIICNYLKGWLVPDTAMLLADWVTIALTTAGEDSGYVRIALACRAVKLLRIMRIFRFLYRATTRMLEFRARFAIQVITCGFVLFISNHFLCCIWWTIGVMGPTENGIHWVEFLDAYGLRGSMTNEYIVAMQWTVATMTLGATTEVTPKTNLERLYNITLLVMAMISGSSLVSFISAQVVQIATLQQDQTRKLHNLRRFLLQEHVAEKLAGEIQRQAVDRLGRQVPIDEADVDVLRMLSTSLRLELIVATRMCHVKKHPLLRIWGQIDASSIESLCQRGTSIAHLQPEDDLFMPTQVAHSAFNLIHGRLKYVQKPAWSMVDMAMTTDVVPDIWICEVALFLAWSHVGKMTAVSHSRLVTVNASGLEEVISMKPIVAHVTKTYARNFHQRVTQAIPPYAPWPTDVHVPHADASDLLSADVNIGLLSLAVQNGSACLSEEQEEKLRKELSEGRCSLHTTESGDLLRVVAVVALALRRPESSQCLYQLGTWTKLKGAAAEFKLPGTKRRMGELPHVAVQRLLEQDLAQLKEHVVLEDSEHSVERTSSPRYGIDTTYLRVVQGAVYEGSDSGDFIMPLNRGTSDLELPAQVYALPNNRGDKVIYYAWLSAESFEQLKALEGSAGVQTWVESLRLAGTEDFDEDRLRAL